MSNDNIKAAVGCVMIVLVLLGLCFYGGTVVTGGIMPEYSTGQRSGKLIQMSRKGLIWKSWEGQIVLNDFAIGKEGSNVFHFSCTDDVLGAAVSEHVGKSMNIHYNQFFIGPIYQSSNYTLIKADHVR